MAHRSQSSSLGENPLDPNYLPPHYREEYRMAIDALVEDGTDGYCGLLQNMGVVEFLSQPEVEHIKSTVQTPNCSSQPEQPYQDTDPDGSSDTYWPVHSDVDAPGLDLGWPSLHSFIGPTEVTTLVNPSDPDTPSIKEHARRLIKTAQHVIALVMDMFTDVDIFSDLLNAAARHVPVYILLDEQNANHFVAMVNNCKVNLDMVKLMRVRTVAGSTYFCRTGKSFKGQVMDRFLLADCRVVLSGNYSFMWSFEKIHRCIAHLFQGELVTTFDEEFRILFAQSEPLVMENALGSRDGNNFASTQFGMTRSQSFRHPQGSAYSFGELIIDGDRNMHPFRRDDSFRHTVEPSHMQFANNKFLPQQFRMERPYLDQPRPMMAPRQIQDNAYKRHSYAEGTLESYSSARQFMKHRVMNNLDEMDSHSSYLQKEQHLYQGGGSASGLYNKIKSQGYYQTDEYSDSGYLPEGDPHGSYNRVVDYLSSSSSKELRQSGTGQSPGDADRYNQTNSKRASAGQPYACQSSPTQLHPPENKRLCGADDSERQMQDHSVKEGLRSWRINSFLSNIEDPGEEGLPMPMGPDAFDEPPQPSEGKLYGPEASVPRFSTRDRPKIPTKPDLLPRFGKPILPRMPKELPTRDLGIVSGSLSTMEVDKVEDAEISDPRDLTLSKHESFRSRVNPMLLRSSRLRSSLIFSSSKLEEHSSVLMKPGTALNDEEDNDRIKPSSIVAQILEKRRSLSREPFDWRKQKKMDIKETSHTEVPESVEPDNVIESSKANLNEHALDGKPNVTEPVDPPKPTASTTIPSRNTSDPENRLSYFKDQLAKQKASRMANESFIRSSEPPAEKPDLSETLAEKIPEKPNIYITPAEPVFKMPPEIPPATSVPVARTSLVTIKPHEPEPVEKMSAENYIKPVTDAMKKDVTQPKSLKPFPSPKLLKKELLKPFKTHSRHVSCGEEIFTDATDSEKSELKKSRSHSSSGMARLEIGEKQLKKHGSSTSLNLVDGGGEGKALEFLKKQTQRLKGLLGPKGDKKASGAAAADDKTNTPIMSTVPEVSEETAPKAHVGPQSPTRYQSSTSNVLYSSNLRDDTKVILEQISANSQKNRIEMAKQAEESKQGGDKDRKAMGKEADPSITYQNRNWFQRAPVSNTQERDSLLKRIESLRKEKKVYSRFEVFYRGKEDPSKNSGFGEKVIDGKASPKIGLLKNKR